MARHHDRSSGVSVRPSGARAWFKPSEDEQRPAPVSDDVIAGDVLSDVLRTVRLTEAVFFVTQASSPWVLEIPDGATLAPAILPSGRSPRYP